MTTTGFPSTKQSILQYLLKQGEATARKLANTLHISPQAVRRHLNELEAEGLVEYNALQQGMGRPQYLYQLSRKGRSLFPQSYGEFALSFLDTLAETVGKEQVSKVLAKQWHKKAAEYRDRVGQGSLQDRVTKLMKLRQEEGYMAELQQVSRRGKKQQFILAEHNCAISEVAESYPSVCGHELEMFAKVLSDCTVERTHWINNGEHRCGYLIQAK